MWKLLIFSTFFLLAFANDSFNGRVLGGQDAKLGQFPHMASLRVFYMNVWRHFCGGSLITEQWVLTAGHCLDGYTESQVKIFVGTVTVNGDGEIYDASLFIIHEGFTTQPVRNDIGLVKLDKAITITNNIRPIRLSDKFVPESTEVTASGFGRIEENAEAETLQYLTQNVWKNGDCDAHLHTVNFTDNNLCAYATVGKGVCNGDSGSPLITGNLQVAIASWVRKPCGGGHPDVYLRVDGYLNWISMQVFTH